LDFKVLMKVHTELIKVRGEKAVIGAGSASTMPPLFDTDIKRLADPHSWWSNHLINFAIHSVVKDPQARGPRVRIVPPVCSGTGGVFGHSRTEIPFKQLGGNSSWREDTVVAPVMLSEGQHWGLWVSFGPARLVVVLDGKGGVYDDPNAKVSGGGEQCESLIVDLA
jgi:hypothetical protein